MTMAPSLAVEEAKRAAKRKLAAEDNGKRKRAKKDKSKFKQDESNNHGTPMKLGKTPDVGIFDSAKKKLRHRAIDKDWADKKRQKVVQEYVGNWRISESMGGRMVDIDSIMTDDEQYLILAYTTSIQVFSTKDSLLIRKICLPISSNSSPEEIVAARLSPTNPNLVWVASSIGRVWKVDWTKGTKQVFKLKCEFMSDLTVEAVQIGGKIQDVPLVSLLDTAWRLLAYNISGPIVKGEKVLVTRGDVMIGNVHYDKNGRALAASSGNNLLFGTLKSSECSTFDDLAYEIFTLDCSDAITCLDMRCSDRVHLSKRSHAEKGDKMVIDIVIGCARGALYYYNDLLPQMRILENPKYRDHSLEPFKLHWHRKAVHAVKWSRDGNYIISGGSEAVLMQWQLDTLKRDPLPHLSATIENIVVSKRGSSYVIHLDDNSTMILSTAERKPTSYISGIQSLVYPSPWSKDNVVARVGQSQNLGPLSRIPAAVNPLDPTRVVICVGNGQQFSSSDTAVSMPLLQTLDLSTVESIAKQAVTRTNPTDVNVTAKGYPLTEPRVTHLAYSHDGKWLATVDEWQPPSRDIETVEGLVSERREVFLKFWTTGADEHSNHQTLDNPKDKSKYRTHEPSLELISRVNAPHFTNRSECVLDLAADPSSHRFATIGEDGAVRVWQPAIRQRDGIVVKSRTGRSMQSWTCAHTVHLQESKTSNSSLTFAGSASKRSGALSFSKDGSILVCAFQNGVESAVYIVATESGEVVDSIDGLIRGSVQELRVLSSQIILLSDDVVVYNIVQGELSYGLPLDQNVTPLHGKPFLTQVAANDRSGTFAVAVSRIGAQGAIQSELAIFSLNQPEPEVVREFPHAILSVMAATSSSGFLILDSAAQVWSVTLGTDTNSISIAQPLSDINLDKEKSGAEVEEEETASEDEMEIDAPEVEMDTDDVYPVVVAPQKLAELFDAAPPFAMPPIEDMFYRVTKLFSSKTATVGSV